MPCWVHDRWRCAPSTWTLRHLSSDPCCLCAVVCTLRLTMVACILQRGDGVPAHHARHHRGKDLPPTNIQAVPLQQDSPGSAPGGWVMHITHTVPKTWQQAQIGIGIIIEYTCSASMCMDCLRSFVLKTEFLKPPCTGKSKPDS